MAQIIILSTKQTIMDWICDARKNWQEASYAKVLEQRVKMVDQPIQLLFE